MRINLITLFSGSLSLLETTNGTSLFSETDPESYLHELGFTDPEQISSLLSNDREHNLSSDSEISRLAYVGAHFDDPDSLPKGWFEKMASSRILSRKVFGDLINRLIKRRSADVARWLEGTSIKDSKTLQKELEEIFGDVEKNDFAESAVFRVSLPVFVDEFMRIIASESDPDDFTKSVESFGEFIIFSVEGF